MFSMSCLNLELPGSCGSNGQPTLTGSFDIRERWVDVKGKDVSALILSPDELIELTGFKEAHRAGP
jgi:hypothetical protein